MFSERKKKDMKKGNQTRKANLQVYRYQELVARNKVCLKNIAFEISEYVQQSLTWNI
jgi:hypothetical protein